MRGDPRLLTVTAFAVGDLRTVTALAVTELRTVAALAVSDLLTGTALAVSDLGRSDSWLDAQFVRVRCCGVPHLALGGGGCR